MNLKSQAPLNYRDLPDLAYLVMIYTHPCTSWAIGLLMLALMRLLFTDEQMKEIHGFFRAPANWSNKVFHPKISFPDTNVERWNTMIEMIPSKFSIDRDVFFQTAQSIYKEKFDHFISFGIEERVSHRLTVKYVEMFHWSRNQECGYGSNRQHQMWCALGMSAGDKEAADSQSWKPWSSFKKHCTCKGTC